MRMFCSFAAFTTAYMARELPWLQNYALGLVVTLLIGALVLAAHALYSQLRIKRALARSAVDDEASSQLVAAGHARVRTLEQFYVRAARVLHLQICLIMVLDAVFVMPVLTHDPDGEALSLSAKISFIVLGMVVGFLVFVLVAWLVFWKVPQLQIKALQSFIGRRLSVTCNAASLDASLGELRLLSAHLSILGALVAFLLNVFTVPLPLNIALWLVKMLAFSTLLTWLDVYNAVQTPTAFLAFLNTRKLARSAVVDLVREASEQADASATIADEKVPAALAESHGYADEKV